MSPAGCLLRRRMAHQRVFCRTETAGLTRIFAEQCCRCVDCSLQAESQTCDQRSGCNRIAPAAADSAMAAAMAGESSESTDVARNGAAGDTCCCTDWNAVICRLCERVVGSCERNLLT